MIDEYDSNGSVLILVGAGTSVGIGIPAMKGMAEGYRKSIKKNTYAYKGLEALEKAGVESDLEEILLEIERIEELSESGAYKAIIQGSKSKRRGNITTTESTRELQRNTRLLKEGIIRWMAEKCFQFDRTAAESAWGDMVKVLLEKEITVFTTNYDFAIEEIAMDHGINVVDNFKTGRHGRRFWDHSLRSFYSDGLRVVKMHGSVDWYATEDRKEIEKFELGASTNREGIRVERVAIFPTRFKDIYESYFFSLYKKFIGELDGSKSFIVIGQSIRDEYIRAAIRESFRRDEFRLIYIGPSIPEALDGLELADKNLKSQIIFIESKFEDVAKTLAYVLKNYGSQEIGKILKEATDFGRKTKLNFYKRVTNVDAGDMLVGELRLLVPAIPPAMVKAELIPESKFKSRIGIELETIEGYSPVMVEGIDENRISIRFKIPEDVPDGEYTLRFNVIKEKDNLLTHKDYVCKVGEIISENLIPEVEQGINEVIEVSDDMV